MAGSRRRSGFRSGIRSGGRAAIVLSLLGAAGSTAILGSASAATVSHSRTSRLSLVSLAVLTSATVPTTTTTTIPTYDPSATVDGPGGVPSSPDEDGVVPDLSNAATFGDAQSWVAAALAARDQALVELDKTLSTARVGPATTRSSLDSVVLADETGIDALVASLTTAGTTASLQSIANSMIVQYRVFAFLVPLVRTTLDLYGQLDAAYYLQGLEPDIEAAITTEETVGVVLPNAESLYKGLLANLGTLVDTDQGDAASLLPLQASDYPSTTSELSGVESDLVTGDTHLQDARDDVRQIVALVASPGLGAQLRRR